MKNIVIIGAGDLGKELVWLIEDINRREPTYLILGFLDDDMSKDTYSFYGYKVLGGTDKLEELNRKTPYSAVMAIQDGGGRVIQTDIEDMLMRLPYSGSLMLQNVLTARALLKSNVQWQYIIEMLFLNTTGGTQWQP